MKECVGMGYGGRNFSNPIEIKKWIFLYVSYNIVKISLCGQNLQDYFCTTHKNTSTFMCKILQIFKISISSYLEFLPKEKAMLHSAATATTLSAVLNPSDPPQLLLLLPPLTSVSSLRSGGMCGRKV